ncbi:MAG: hypothetical protein PVTTEEND_000698, partial [Candidatus Fervidibacter sp.]
MRVAASTLAFSRQPLGGGVGGMGELKTVGVPDRRHRFVRPPGLPPGVLVGG